MGANDGKIDPTRTMFALWLGALIGASGKTYEQLGAACRENFPYVVERRKEVGLDVPQKTPGFGKSRFTAWSTAGNTPGHEAVLETLLDVAIPLAQINVKHGAQSTYLRDFPELGALSFEEIRNRVLALRNSLDPAEQIAPEYPSAADEGPARSTVELTHAALKPDVPGSTDPQTDLRGNFDRTPAVLTSAQAGASPTSLNRNRGRRWSARLAFVGAVVTMVAGVLSGGTSWSSTTEAAIGVYPLTPISFDVLMLEAHQSFPNRGVPIRIPVGIVGGSPLGEVDLLFMRGRITEAELDEAEFGELVGEGSTYRATMQANLIGNVGVWNFEWLPSLSEPESTTWTLAIRDRNTDRRAMETIEVTRDGSTPDPTLWEEVSPPRDAVPGYHVSFTSETAGFGQSDSDGNKLETVRLGCGLTEPTAITVVLHDFDVTRPYTRRNVVIRIGDLEIQKVVDLDTTGQALTMALFHRECGKPLPEVEISVQKVGTSVVGASEWQWIEETVITAPPPLYLTAADQTVVSATAG